MLVHCKQKTKYDCSKLQSKNLDLQTQISNATLCLEISNYFQVATLTNSQIKNLLETSCTQKLQSHPQTSQVFVVSKIIFNKSTTLISNTGKNSHITCKSSQLPPTLRHVHFLLKEKKTINRVQLCLTPKQNDNNKALVLKSSLTKT